MPVKIHCQICFWSDVCVLFHFKKTIPANAAVERRGQTGGSAGDCDPRAAGRVSVRDTVMRMWPSLAEHRVKLVHLQNWQLLITARGTEIIHQASVLELKIVVNSGEQVLQPNRGTDWLLCQRYLRFLTPLRGSLLFILTQYTILTANIWHLTDHTIHPYTRLGWEIDGKAFCSLCRKVKKKKFNLRILFFCLLAATKNVPSYRRRGKGLELRKELDLYCQDVH